MDPPVPRRLVGESQIPPSLSPTYSGTSKNLSKLGWLVNIRAGSQTSLRLRRLPVRPQMWPGLSDTGPVVDPSAENTGSNLLTGLSSPAVHVLNKSANSHGEASSPWPTAHEAHSMASQNNWRVPKSLGRSFLSPSLCIPI